MTDAPPLPPGQSVEHTTVYGHLLQIAGVSGNVSVRLDGMAPVRGQVVEGDIPQRPRGFQVRQDLLARLHDQVAADGAALVCALTGTPGVGKTLLAASYAWACQAAGWPVVAWIAAETEDQILAGLDGLAARVGVRAADDDAATAAGKAKAWLAGSTQPGLVVFDNAAEVQVVRRWCPATGATRVVITSRNRAFHRHYTPVHVEVFTPAQALAFLTERTELADAAAAAELADELGHLPLPLAQAAAVIAWKKIDYRSYLRLLRTFPLQEYLTPLREDAYPAGTAEAILLSITQAEAAITDARAMLETLAVLSPAGVPRHLLYGAPSPDLADRAAVDEILARLADTSLLTFSKDGSVILMHRLVQRVLRERAQHENRLEPAVADATTLLEALNDLIPDGAATWSARAAVETLHEQTSALYTIVPTGTLSPDLLALRYWCGLYLHALADLPRAIDLLTQVLADCERVLGADHPGTLTSRNILASAYESAGRVEEAISLFEQALTERERVLGVDHPDTLVSCNNLASAYGSAGRLEEAVLLYETTLVDCERVLGTDHPTTLTSRNNLASAYGSAGRLEKAISLFEQALTERERVLGTDHPDTLASRNNLAGAYKSVGRLEEAISLFEQTLADWERVLGTDHPDTLISRNNLACAYESAGRVEEAISLFEQALADRERVLGTDHPDTLTSRNDLAGAYESVGRVEEAISLFEQTLADRERVLGTDHPDTLASRNTLAYTYGSAGRMEEAVLLYEATLVDCERVLSPGHPLTQSVRENLDAAYQAVSSRTSWWQRMVRPGARGLIDLPSRKRWFPGQ